MLQKKVVAIAFFAFSCIALSYLVYYFIKKNKVIVKLKEEKEKIDFEKKIPHISPQQEEEVKKGHVQPLEKTTPIDLELEAVQNDVPNEQQDEGLKKNEEIALKNDSKVEKEKSPIQPLEKHSPIGDRKQEAVQNDEHIEQQKVGLKDELEKPEEYPKNWDELENFFEPYRYRKDASSTILKDYLSNSTVQRARV